MKEVASNKNRNNLAQKQVKRLDTVKRLSDGCLLQLHQRLMVTADMNTLINRFRSWINDFHRVDGVAYVHLDEKVTILSGEAKRHKAHYVLRLEQYYLGEMTLTSHRRFSEQDLLTQEQGMGILVHYLKNALNQCALERVAIRDSLTGVMNRTALDELFPKEVARAQRYGYDLSILMIDIDHFKSINDTVGHMGGDEILRHVAKAIKGHLRNSDLPFRYGGDEFLVALPNTSLKGAHSAAKQIMKAISKVSVVSPEHKRIKPQLSIGIASRHDGESREDLIQRADAALYRAKENGRNCIA